LIHDRAHSGRRFPAAQQGGLSPEVDNLGGKTRRSGTAAPARVWPFHVLLIALVLSPLPFGSVFQWSWAGLAVVVGLLLLLSISRPVSGPGAPPSVVSRLWLPGLLYLLAVGWVAIQASGATPQAWHHPIWGQTAETLGARTNGGVSVNPYDTRSDLLKMLTFAGIFWLAVVYGRARERVRAALWVLGIAGAFYALYGIVAELTEAGAVLWFHDMPNHRQGVTSTLVNRNMYVVYAAFGFLSVTCLFLDLWLSFSRTTNSRPIRWTLFVHETQSKTFLLLILAVVALVALVMTGSRGGVLASAVASAVLTLCLVRRQQGAPSVWRPLFQFSMGFLVFWAGLFVLAGAHLGSRVAESASGAGDGRIAGYRMIISAIREAPLTGFGGASSRDVFYLHNDGVFWNTFNYAHNLYLGAAVEMGIPAAAAMMAAAALVALSCLKGIWRRRRDQAFPALGVAVTALIAVHGLVDSPLYLPANAATYSFLLGLAFAQSWSTRAPLPSSKAAAQPRQNAQPLPGSDEAQSE
jgi:O-antigen ligase